MYTFRSSLSLPLQQTAATTKANHIIMSGYVLSANVCINCSTIFYSRAGKYYYAAMSRLVDWVHYPLCTMYGLSVSMLVCSEPEMVPKQWVNENNKIRTRVMVSRAHYDCTFCSILHNHIHTIHYVPRLKVHSVYSSCIHSKSTLKVCCIHIH